jgi:hypothetical protein
VFGEKISETLENIIEQQHTFREEDIKVKIIYVTGIMNEKKHRYSLPYYSLFTNKLRVLDVLLPNAVIFRL